MMNWIRLVFALFIGLSAADGTLAAERRVALVIGNSAYQSAPLRNPANDAQDMASRLRNLGFDVIERTNLRTRQIGATLREFRGKLAPGAVALVFYAGHGVQIKGENYLPAVDAQIEGEEDVPNQSLAVKQIMDVLADAGTRLNLVFLDSCRDNPYQRSFRSLSRGLSRESVPSGTLMSFATRPGGVADDGTGRNGVYTAALLRSMVLVDQPIERVLKNVVTLVKAETRNRQEPWIEGSITGEFCFGPCAVAQAVGVSSASAGTASAPIAALTAEQRDDQFWQDARSIGNREAYEAYLNAYPAGRYAALARAAIGRLQAAGAGGVASAGGAGAAGSPAQAAPLAQGTMRPPPPPPPPLARTGLGAPGTVFKDCDECPEMVVIPGGSFLMGSPPGEGFADERPQRWVQVGALAMGRFEVTQRQWFAVMGARPSRFAGDDRPVENVSWDDAQTFVARLSERTGRRYRLPSEAEWEYAARAGSTTAYPFGSDASRLGTFAWFTANSGGTTQPVGRLQPNAFGLYDMLGNVWEWTEDCWNGSYAGAPTDGRAWTAGECGRRVLRGGSWSGNPRNVRAAYRYGFTSALRFSDYGFRVARTD